MKSKRLWVSRDAEGNSGSSEICVWRTRPVLDARGCWYPRGGPEGVCDEPEFFLCHRLFVKDTKIKLECGTCREIEIHTVGRLFRK